MAEIRRESLAAFWTLGTGIGGAPFDPRIAYDSLSGRWVAAVAVNSRSAQSQLWVAVSSSSDPTQAWSFYVIDGDAADTRWVDFPSLGINADWVAITANMFTIPGAFAGSKMWVIEKSGAFGRR